MPLTWHIVAILVGVSTAIVAVAVAYLHLFVSEEISETKAALVEQLRLRMDEVIELNVSRRDER